MKRTLVAGVAVACLAWAAPAVKREALVSMEKSLGRGLEGAQMEILGLPRGIYLQGYGAVFTADVNLTYTPSINPFHLTISKEEIASIHQRKLAQMPHLRTIMKQCLLESGASLDSVPLNEQVVIGVTLGHDTWERTTGLPSQIIMKAVRSALLNAKIGKVPPDSVIQTEEL